MLFSDTTGLTNSRISNTNILYTRDQRRVADMQIFTILCEGVLLRKFAQTLFAIGSNSFACLIYVYQCSARDFTDANYLSETSTKITSAKLIIKIKYTYVYLCILTVIINLIDATLVMSFFR